LLQVLLFPVAANMLNPVTILSWPRAILHVDCDSFFASVEQSLTPAYQGRPIVTGRERGIAIAVSLEAKRLGIKRGMTTYAIKKNHPNCLIVPGNYEAYMIYSRRMFAILRRFTPIVDEYSIDEAFIDIAGLRLVHRKNYKEIAVSIKKTIEQELGITVSVGVSINKSLAKLCSKAEKPNGLTCVKGKHVHLLLQKTPIEQVWGIGKNNADFLRNQGCKTAHDFIKKPLSFIKKNLTKKEEEIYRELKGEFVYDLNTLPKDSYKSISKSKTFEATRDKEKIFSELVKNIEEATQKCRKYKLAAKKLVVLLKTQSFNVVGQKATLSCATASPFEIVAVARQLFEMVYQSQELYRTTVCILTDITEDNDLQLSLFESVLKIEKLEKLSFTMDKINKKHGPGSICLAARLPTQGKSKSRLSIPFMDISV